MMPLSARRNVRIDFCARNGPFPRPLQQAGDRAFRLERHLAGQHLVADQAERKNVRPLIQVLAQRLFRRHVLHRPHQRAGLRHAVAFDGPRQPKIHHHHAAGIFPHHVLRLQVAVQNAHAVRGLERKTNLLQNVDRLVGRQLVAFFEDRAQVPSRNHLHGHEAHPRVFRQVVHAHHVAVRHLAARAAAPA